MAATKNGKIDRVEIRMYRMGTGDCFALKFFTGTSNVPSFKMLIDCGACYAKTEQKAHIENLTEEYLEDDLDVLVVTHEHDDHVNGFKTGEEYFEKLTTKEIWLSWTENDTLTTVKKWRKEHGQKKLALQKAADELDKSVAGASFLNSLKDSAYGADIEKRCKGFVDVLKGFSDLHVDELAGPLPGMEIVKKTIKENNNVEIAYMEPGQIEERAGAKGIKFYVLGPPKDWDSIAIEHGGEGESYKHNKDIRNDNAFEGAVLAMGDKNKTNRIKPFNTRYEETGANTEKLYTDATNDWRRIDSDWLFSSGNLALRLNSLTNNCSLVLAIEFEDTEKVLLFSGDAEYGSWASWHDIDWKKKRNDKPLTTEILLNNTVFFKVAHHFSSNGTASKAGLDMMTSDEFAVMAALDYNNIRSGWKSTMPNAPMLKDILDKSRGKLMVMNEEGLHYDAKNTIPLTKEIKRRKAKMSDEEKEHDKENFKSDDLYLQYTVYNDK